MLPFPSKFQSSRRRFCSASVSVDHFAANQAQNVANDFLIFSWRRRGAAQRRQASVVHTADKPSAVPTSNFRPSVGFWKALRSAVRVIDSALLRRKWVPAKNLYKRAQPPGPSVTCYLADRHLDHCTSINFTSPQAIDKHTKNEKTHFSNYKH